MTMPTITSVIPTKIPRGEVRELTVVGTGFVDGATAHIPDSAEVQPYPKTGVGSATEFVSSTELRVKVYAEPAAVLGPRDLRITNPDESEDTLTDAIDAVPAVPPPRGPVSTASSVVSSAGEIAVESVLVNPGEVLLAWAVTLGSTTTVDGVSHGAQSLALIDSIETTAAGNKVRIGLYAWRNDTGQAVTATLTASRDSGTWLIAHLYQATAQRAPADWEGDAQSAEQDSGVSHSLNLDVTGATTVYNVCAFRHDEYVLSESGPVLRHRITTGALGVALGSSLSVAVPQSSPAIADGRVSLDTEPSPSAMLSVAAAALRRGGYRTRHQRVRSR